ncbi:MAG TPA: hypothetical protein VL967_01590 [Terracidiphilus sp.]|nr:hypothetical protein [Terracidiphilus sp.]
MTANRHKNAWIWIAVAAMAAVTLARAETGMPHARVSANPVLAFLSNRSITNEFSASRIPGMLGRVSERRVRSSSGPTAGVWTAILPIFFVGLIAPLNLVPACAMLCIGRAISAPALPFRFQRPPPSFLF